jgi:hypothetical protein
MRLFTVPIRTFLLFQYRDEISFNGEGCDTLSATRVAIVFYSTSTVQSSLYLGLKFEFQFKPCL